MAPGEVPGDVFGAVLASLAAGDLDEAAAALEASLAEVDDPQLRRLLGGLRYLDDRLEEARREWELAFRGLREAGEPRAAARVAADLAELHMNAFGNEHAGRGWVARANRVLEGLGPCVERGYVELALLACDRPDVDELERSAERALALAAAFGDTDLEVRALADSGLALVSQGRASAGFGRLDEALAALSAGEVRDPAVVGRSFCALLTSCERAGDAGRAAEWIRLVDEHVLAPLGGRPRVLRSHCRLAYGSVLAGAGRWAEAEQVIGEVLGPPGSSSTVHRLEAVARLAELRLLQGRVEEAAALVAAHEGRLAVALPLAAVHLARGEAAVAVAVASHARRQLVGDVLRSSPLLLVEVEAQLALGDPAAARAAAAELAAAAAASESPIVTAQAGLAMGLVDAASGDSGAAEARLAACVEALQCGERPVLEGRARLERAEVLAAAGQEAEAVVEVRAALAVLEPLGAAPLVDRAAALARRLGAGSRVVPRTSASFASLTSREAEVLELVKAGATNAEIGRRLYLSPKTVEHHVGRILAKLGVRSRAEAAALAAAAAAGGG